MLKSQLEEEGTSDDELLGELALFDTQRGFIEQMLKNTTEAMKFYTAVLKTRAQVTFFGGTDTGKCNPLLCAHQIHACFLLE